MNRILLGNRSSNSFGVVAATLQPGHSKSPYSTSVTRACSEPWRWSVGSGGTAKVIEWDCVLIEAAPGFSRVARGQFDRPDFHTNHTRSAQQLQLAVAPDPARVEQALQAVDPVDGHAVERDHTVAGLDPRHGGRAARHQFQDVYRSGTMQSEMPYHAGGNG